ncbi:MAG: hypothetical protein IKR09_06100 [Alphaproteobacteria bacterium]|nr:hypothetical protein [Alphaproteobacteria bacterium]
MKKFLLLTLPLLVSCAQEYWNNEKDTFSTDTSEVNEDSADVSEKISQEPISEQTNSPAKIPNAKCMNMKSFEVLQVFQDRYALAFNCKNQNDDHCLGTTVLLAPQKDVDYYDHLRVDPPVGRCAVQDGVYRYENKERVIRTVPVIRWGYKYEPENEEEYLERLKELSGEAIDECRKSHVLKKTDTSENMQKCECIVKEEADSILKGKEISNSEIEKKCSNNIIKKKKKHTSSKP